jgi:hypothetical protein
MSFPDFVYLAFNLLSALLAAIAGYQWWQSYDAARLGDQNESLNRNWKAALAASLAAFGQALVIGRPVIDFLVQITGAGINAPIPLSQGNLDHGGRPPSRQRPQGRALNNSPILNLFPLLTPIAELSSSLP